MEPTAPGTAHLPHVLDLLDAHFSQNELYDLCFTFAIDPENLPGTTKRAKMRALLRFMARRERLPELRAYCIKERPAVPWAQTELVPGVFIDDDDTVVDSFVLLGALPADRVPAVASLPPLSRMPYPPNPLFVGRTAEFRHLARLLKEQRTAVLAAATGIGGVGKTQLSSEFAHRYGRFFAGGVFWLNCAQAESVKLEVAACGVALKLPGFEALKLDDQVARVRQEWQQPIPRLLIFDNCEDETILATWRPTTGGSRVLVTSRRATWDTTLGVATLALEVLPRAESIALLRGFRPDLAADDADLDALAEEVGNLPLALHLAGSFLKAYRHDVTPAAYLRELRAEVLDHESLHGNELRVSPTGHELHVANTFAISYRCLRDDNSTDVLALALLGRATYCAPGVALPRDLLLAMVEMPDEQARRRASRALRRLIDVGLVEEVAEGALRLHRLIAQFARVRVTDAAAQAAVEEALIDESHRCNEARYPGPLRVIQPHLEAVTNAAFERDDERAAALCNNLGSLLQAMGDFAIVRPYYERALAISERVLGTDHPNTASSLNNLGTLLQDMGDLAAARPYFERALTIRERVLGTDHLDTAMSLNNLGLLLQAVGDLAGARPYYERALAIHQWVLGAEHPSTATILNNMGGVLQAQGDLTRAHVFYHQALMVRERVLGVEHPDTAMSLNNLGYLLQAQGDLAGAHLNYERALAIQEQVMGADHISTAISLNNLGYLFQVMGELGDARPYYERALAIHERVLGADHPSTATSLNNLGYLLQAQGNLVSARPYYERALAIREQRLGADHPDTATSLNNLGGLLQAMGDLAAARLYKERALDIRERVLGADHPSTAMSLNNLGKLLQAMGDLAGARLFFERALAICEKSLGTAHPSTQRVRDNLARLAAPKSS